LAAKQQHDGGGAAALALEIGRHGWSNETEKRLIEMLEHGMEIMGGSSDRLYSICEDHPTPAVIRQLMHIARTSEPTMRYSAGAFLLYLAGYADDWYGLGEHRSRLLGLNSSAHGAAVAWLEDMVAHPKRDTSG
jgi:hypothetical protein